MKPSIEYLRTDDIILINHLTLERHGGNFVPPKNILKEESLHYLIEAVEGSVFGQAMYPEIHDKAGYYFFSIISNHIFQDGNKRTGLEAALLFLRLNGYQLKRELIRIESELKQIPSEGETSNEVLFNFTIETAAGKINLEESGLWFKANIEKINFDSSN